VLLLVINNWRPSLVSKLPSPPFSSSACRCHDRWPIVCGLRVSRSLCRGHVKTKKPIARNCARDCGRIAYLSAAPSCAYCLVVESRHVSCRATCLGFSTAVAPITNRSHETHSKPQECRGEEFDDGSAKVRIMVVAAYT